MSNFLITGGTSGLGLALAILAHERGAKVAVVARDAGKLEGLGRMFPGIVRIQADVGRKDDIYRISLEAVEKLGQVDVLVNNASELGPTPLRLLLDTECEDLGRVLETNLMGPFRLTKAVIPGMILRGRGLVVNISSDAALSAYPRWGAYGVSKAALDHLSRIWDAELAELAGDSSSRVRFLAVDPTDMDTPMHRAAAPQDDPTQLNSPDRVAASLFDLIQQAVPDSKLTQDLTKRYGLPSVRLRLEVL